MIDYLNKVADTGKAVDLQQLFYCYTLGKDLTPTDACNNDVIQTIDRSLFGWLILSSSGPQTRLVRLHLDSRLVAWRTQNERSNLLLRLIA